MHQLASLSLIFLWLAVQSGIVAAQSTPDTEGQARFEVEQQDGQYIPLVKSVSGIQLSPPEEGLWSIATAWDGDWPSEWRHVEAMSHEQVGDWDILEGSLDLPEGKWIFRDAYRYEQGLVKCVRRYEWTGEEALDSVTLSVRWRVPGAHLSVFMPGILYYGNPSGTANTPGRVPSYNGLPGEFAVFEEHRFPMPFVALENSIGAEKYGAAVHSLPSPVKNPRLPDHWWSMGALADSGSSELVLYSGPVGYNGRRSVAKATQKAPVEYNDTYFTASPGMVIEKTFYLDVFPIARKGTGFQKPLYDALELHEPYSDSGLPAFADIVGAKYRMAVSRYVEDDSVAGFNMYEPADRQHIVMGWCGQAASPGYSLQHLREFQAGDDHDIHRMVQKSLDFLTTTNPSEEAGFSVNYNIRKGIWTKSDHVSVGQAMYNFASAIRSARANGQYQSAKWEAFLIEACDFASARILDPKWYPRSTAEGFYIAPLIIAHSLFGTASYKDAAVKAATHYADRHLSMEEPYWGGTLDATGEDKEGAWAAFQGFLTLYEHLDEKKYLAWAKHAGEVCLSYTVVWDIPLPPGRLADHGLKTRGWTVVSPQNQHVDIYGVLYSPEIYKLGEYLDDPRLQQLAKIMFLSCGQLIDPSGSQGEQLQQTNFAQRGEVTDVYALRGGYAESWTVFWITAHFLNAAARFDEMGVKL
ncbi:hypothetical protein [Parapedobacter tibetensis]|uniref:hypothetical protein n=1 Tax=Parapedobacter tibetensis TaxID=2972951 RepID=UPI00214D9025|nr:hypothetical protein [Parapedobacter tibetensis]